MISILSSSLSGNMNTTQNDLIVIFVADISRSSGGVSSILDLSEALYKLGYPVAVVCRSGHLVYLSNKLLGRNKTKTILPPAVLWTLPATFSSKKNVYRSGFHKKVSSILRSLGTNEKKFSAMLEDASIIIDACRIGNEKIAKLKGLTNAKILANHAGSPEAFIKYWMTDEVIGTDTNLKSHKGCQERYIAWAKAYDNILFQCQEHADQAVELGAVAQASARVVYPSCQEDAVLLASNLNNPYRNPGRHIVCVGSLQYRKGQDLALEAFALVDTNASDVHLHFVGGGLETEFGASLLHLSESLRLTKKITFHGHRGDYLRYMAHAHCILQSSRAEGVSRILREAMLMQKPIVSFAISGTTSILSHQVDAELVEPGSSEALANGMTRVLGDNDYAKKISNNAFERYLRKHSISRYCSTIKDMISGY